MQLCVPDRLPTQRRWLRRCFSAAGDLVFNLATAEAVDPDDAFRRAGGLPIYLGVVPAAVIRGHPLEHYGRGLHGSAPQDRHAHHLLVGVLDGAIGERVPAASVTASARGLQHTPASPMEPMIVGDGIAYGGFTTLPVRAFYRIEIEVVPGEDASPVRVVFPHQLFQP